MTQYKTCIWLSRILLVGIIMIPGVFLEMSRGIAQEKNSPDIREKTTQEPLPDIFETVREGEAYGFRIGDNKPTTFSRIALLFSQQKVWHLTTFYPYGIGESSFREPEDVAEYFSDWSRWTIKGFADAHFKRVFLGFSSATHTLERISGMPHDRAKFPRRIPVWPPEGEDTPHLKEGMSYEDVYTTLLQLKTREKYRHILVQPNGFNVITVFNDTELNRIQRWDDWCVEMYPIPEGSNLNYLRLLFNDDKLIEITRVRETKAFHF